MSKAEKVRRGNPELEAWWERYSAAIATGLTESEALTFATDGSLDQLAKLIEAGCDVRMIARIVA